MQIGAPGEVYERPNTLFTAEFLGSTNVLRGRTKGNRGGSGVVMLETGAEIYTAAIASEQETDILVTVRPEKVAIEARYSAENNISDCVNCLDGTVQAVQYLGSSITYIVDVGIGPFTVFQQNRDAQVFAPGSKVCLTWLSRHSVVVDE